MSQFRLLEHSTWINLSVFYLNRHKTAQKKNKSDYSLHFHKKKKTVRPPTNK